MTPDAVREWIAILRDLVIVGLGTFMCVHETVGGHDLTVIGAGLTLLGVPPALRLDDRRRRKKEAEDA